ncbi:Bug family tripartite tricarboxylate transporter substrate binding protein [Pseudorhodoferax soli]|uniref:Tripartite-type tricarboxylate transporter receptor subunit TctC n=1 Tax=Pseudorhodoferax soli TaxID=545864 RepID=A0A368XQY0_9BURK|nr:tripartite tricarboxylate transporter substrate binding protein [Pseudorhodoferax soli]RCW70440.1 tripartite-type tricarboxylate transporter receptor subunit TctC [Pseudorhodoferax soli]
MIKLNRRVLTALLLATASGLAFAQAWPAKPIRMVIPYPPGGPTDILGRIVAQQLEARLGQPVVVDNKPGASGMIGADIVAKAPPDGTTLLVNASIHVINPSLYKKPPHDAIRDFAPVSLIADVPLVLVAAPSQGFNTVQDVIAAAKADPKRLNFASSGNAAAPHLAGEAFKIATGVQMQHVPYKGSGPALADVIGGQTQLMFDSMPSSIGQIRAGKLRAIAVTTAKRASALPDVPTIAESGVPGYDISTWYGVWAPPGTPAEIVDRVSQEIAQIVRQPAVRERLAALGAEPVGNTPQEFAAYTRSELAKWERIVKASGATVD